MVWWPRTRLPKDEFLTIRKEIRDPLRLETTKASPFLLSRCGVSSRPPDHWEQLKGLLGDPLLF